MSSCVSDREEYYSVPPVSNETITPKEFYNLLGEYFKGNLYIIPFKIGDIAYIIRNYKGTHKIQSGSVSEIYLNFENKPYATVKNFGRGEIGKKVFATQEDAEAYLQKEEKL